MAFVPKLRDKSPPPTFVPALESLRGFAALSVAIFHVITAVRIDGEQIFGRSAWEMRSLQELELRLGTLFFNGSGGVSLFFVLSGFVLMLSLKRVERGWAAKASRFVISRFIRIYPALLVNLGVMAVVLPPAVSLGILPANWPVPSWHDLAQNAALLSPTVNGASWTLAIEFEAIPFILVAYAAWSRFGVLALMACACLGTMALFSEVTLTNGIRDFVFMFFLGMLATELCTWARWFTPSCTIGAVMLLLSSRFIFGYGSKWSVFAEGLGATLLVAGVVFGPRWSLHQLLNWSGARWLGRISYSFYLYHPLVVPFAVFSFGWTPANPLILASKYSILIVGLTLPLAWTSWRYVEQLAVLPQRRKT